LLLTGEAGTGKELFARCIHNTGPNASAPFVAINCAAMPAQLVEVELFGQETGQPGGAASAKRGVLELVGAGTVLLKDIGELASSLQVRLQRVIEVGHVRRLGAVEEVPVQCRIIVTSKLKLEERVAAGSFSSELLAVSRCCASTCRRSANATTTAASSPITCSPRSRALTAVRASIWASTRPKCSARIVAG
jgi:DNA-binding NtrC family response regulator